MTQKTTYVLQFLWRDLSPDFDLIGPYFTSCAGLDSRFTLACLFETMQSLQSDGFKVKALICDGASWNLSMLKKLCGQEESDHEPKEGSEDISDSHEDDEITVLSRIRFLTHKSSGVF